MIKIVNNQVVDISKLSVTSYDDLREVAVEKALRCVSIGGYEVEKDKIQLFILMSDNKDYQLATVILDRTLPHNSISKEIPSWVNFEREVYENYNINFENHPYLKPVRFAKDRAISMKMEEFPFFKINGENIHEVGVGPVHAGVIEPGHFRFMCRGEQVDHLEIQLGYQHRGVEKLMKQKPLWKQKTLVESINGDSTLVNSMIYCSIVESLGKIKISKRAQMIRLIGVELERTALHLATLTGIANDVAYLMGTAFIGATRTYVINSIQSICGNRFGHGLMGIGGVNFDIDENLKNELIATLTMVKKRIEDFENCFLSSSGVLNRLENTGVVNAEISKKLGLTGVSARSAGLHIDTRYMMNDEYYNKYIVNSLHRYPKRADVYARTKQRICECHESLLMVLDMLQNLENGEIKQAVKLRELKFEANQLVVSFGEGPRGENVHMALTKESDTKVAMYKVKDPSFINWYALAISLRGNQISDFPLCNKSFDLSYCGSDL